MPDFNELMRAPADTFKRPIPLPVGTYQGRMGKYEIKKSKEKQTPYIQWQIQLLAAGDDIKPEDLSGIEVEKKVLSRNFFVTPDASYRLTEFLKTCGIDVAGRTFNELLPEAMGASVLVSVIQRPSKDGKELFNEIQDLVGTHGQS